MVPLEDRVGPVHPLQVELQVHEVEPERPRHVVAGEEGVELVAPAAPGGPEVEEDELLLARRLRQGRIEQPRRRGPGGGPRLQERLHLGRVVVVALLKRVGLLAGDDLARAVQHGQERVADAPQVPGALGQQALGVGGLGVDHHEHIFVGQNLVDGFVRGEQPVELVAPAAPVAAEHDQHAPGVAAGQGGGGLDLVAGVGLGVVDRGFGRFFGGGRPLGRRGGRGGQQQGDDGRSEESRHGWIVSRGGGAASNLGGRLPRVNRIPGLSRPGRRGRPAPGGRAATRRTAAGSGPPAGSRPGASG